jgi:hypothetical protein
LTKHAKSQKIERGTNMDPTKSFDHLDPKLKETYARVMGTTTGGAANAAPGVTDPAPTATPNLLATPTTFDPTQPAADANPLSAPLTQSPTQPNPGTGPTISSPSDSPSFMSAPTTPSPVDQSSAPANSSFFSNPSPASTDPTQPTDTTNVATPEIPAGSPVTPYIPTDSTTGAPAEGYTQPLPSPSSVNQASEHQTSPLLKVLYIIGAVIFFAIYTIFWIKVFNLPFLF